MIIVQGSAVRNRGTAVFTYGCRPAGTKDKADVALITKCSNMCLCVCFEDVLACMIKTVNLNRKNLTKKKRRTSYKSMQVRETT